MESFFEILTKAYHSLKIILVIVAVLVIVSIALNLF